MLILSSATATISVVTTASGAVSLHATYVDSSASGTTSIITPYGVNQPQITGITTTTMVSSPASGQQRNVQTLLIKNVSTTVSNQITVNHYDGTNTAELYQATHFPGYFCQWVFGRGWETFNASGAQLQAAAGAGPQYAQEINVTGSASTNSGPTTMVNGNVLILWGSNYSGAKTQSAPTATGTLNELTIKDTTNTIASTGGITFSPPGYSPSAADDNQVYINSGYATWADSLNGWERVR